MVDSKWFLHGQTIAYTFYCIVIILLVAWFAWKVTGKGRGKGVKPALFYTFVGFLTVLGVSLHIITLTPFPGQKWTLTGLIIRLTRHLTLRSEPSVYSSCRKNGNKCQ